MKRILPSTVAVLGLSLFGVAYGFGDPTVLFCGEGSGTHHIDIEALGFGVDPQSALEDAESHAWAEISAEHFVCAMECEFTIDPFATDWVGGIGGIPETHFAPCPDRINWGSTTWTPTLTQTPGGWTAEIEIVGWYSKECLDCDAEI